MDYNYKAYREMKRDYLEQLRKMRPAIGATQEMKDAFINAVEDFYINEEDYAGTS